MPVVWSPKKGEHVKIINGPANGRRGTVQQTEGDSHRVLVERDTSVWCLYEDIEPTGDFTNMGGWCRGYGK